MPNDSIRGNWTSVSPGEARELSRQAETFDDNRRQSERTTRAIDDALTGTDWQRVVPPGEDPRTYINAMVGKAGGGNFVTPALDSSHATQVAFAPTALTIRSPAGTSRAPNAAQPGDLLEIEVGGRKVTMRCDDAVRQGFIKQDRDGGYKALSSDDREEARQQVQREQQERQTLNKAELPALRESGDEPDEEAQASINAVTSRVPGEAVSALVEDWVKNGTLSAANVARVGQSVGFSAEQAAGLTTSVVEGLQRQAAAAVATAGIAREEAQAAYDWMAEHYPSEHQNAARALILGSDAKGLKALAAKYVAWKRQQQA